MGRKLSRTVAHSSQLGIGELGLRAGSALLDQRLSDGDFLSRRWPGNQTRACRGSTIGTETGRLTHGRGFGWHAGPGPPVFCVQRFGSRTNRMGRADGDRYRLRRRDPHAAGKPSPCYTARPPVGRRHHRRHRRHNRHSDLLLCRHRHQRTDLGRGGHLRDLRPPDDWCSPRFCLCDSGNRAVGGDVAVRRAPDDCRSHHRPHDAGQALVWQGGVPTSRTQSNRRLPVESGPSGSQRSRTARTAGATGSCT